MTIIIAMVSAMIGAAIGAIVMGVLTGGKATDAEQALQEALKAAHSKLDMMQARLRGFQDYAYKCHDGECMYILQRANGRFARVSLPEV
jgi:uncharacterized membrane-anchored protein YhcB (DUF1043 family)